MHVFCGSCDSQNWNVGSQFTRDVPNQSDRLSSVEHWRRHSQKYTFLFTMEVNGQQFSLVATVLQNIFFCVLQKKKSQSDMRTFSFLIRVKTKIQTLLDNIVFNVTLTTGVSSTAELLKACPMLYIYMHGKYEQILSTYSRNSSTE